jgi:phosphonate transport system substrate-binding protein
MEQYDLMLKNGLDPEKDLAFYTIPPGSYKHEALIYGVLYGKYDAGAFPMLDFEKMIEDGRINPADFRVIATGAPIPYCTFGASQKVDDKLAEKCKEALLSITNNTTVEVDGEVVQVLKRAKLNGFKEVTDKEYDIVRDMARNTNMPPYQKY